MLNGLMGRVSRVVKNPIFLYVVAAAIIFLSLGHYLGTHPSGFGPGEVATRSVAQSPTKILNNPINAPHNLVAYVIHLAGISWRSSLRLASALFWIAFVFCFYILVKALFGKQIGLMGALIFAATPILAIMGRDGSANIMFYSAVAIAAAYAWAVKTPENRLAVICLACVCALSIYTPGMLLLLLGGIIICRKKVAAIIETSQPAANVAAILIGILILCPLAIALVKDWTLIKQLLLIPTSFAQPITILKEIAWMGLAIFVRAPHPSPFLLGRLPVLNILATALFVFGAFALWNAARIKLLTYLLVIIYAVILAGLNDNVSILAIAIPAIAIILTAGLRYLFVEWRGIFPRNPLAKTLALSLMWLVVIIQLAFGFRYVVSAWPASPTTHTSYVLK